MDQRAGLLVGRGGDLGQPTVYSFPHRTFQEYLAGCYLSGQRDRPRAFYEHAGEGDTWNLAAILGAEELHYNRRSTNELLNLAYTLCSVEKPEDEQCWRSLLWSAQMAVVAEKERVAEDDVPNGGVAYLNRVRRGLVALLEANVLSPAERAAGGLALAKLDDPRPEVLQVDAMPLCYIPAGPFLMGSDPKKDQYTEQHEQPQHEVTLPAYWISRYPVTNAQYAEFVQDGGYQVPEFWIEAQQAGCWENGAITRRTYDFTSDGDIKEIEETESTPHDFGEPFNFINYLVVGITWYESQAFTRWLTHRWREQGWLLENWQVSLPGEAQWEKAARGGLQVPKQISIRTPQGENKGWLLDTGNYPLEKNKLPARSYPWGDEFSANFANTAEVGIGITTAVGCFPGGASPYGVLEVSGNVWEWTRTIWDTEKFSYPYQLNDGREDISEEKSRAQRVLRGGSCLDDRRNARCARRLRYNPGYWYGYVGFRVVVSPLNSVL